MNPKILRPKQAAAYCGFSVATLWAKTNPKNRRHDASFPKPFKLGNGSRAVGILKDDLDAWIATQRQPENGETKQC